MSGEIWKSERFGGCKLVSCYFKTTRMRKLLTTITILWITNISFSQTLESGEYDSGLKLAYDSITNKLTGYFENYTGLDEETGNAKFSCIFYIQGSVTGSQFIVETYYPNGTSDFIKGTFKIISEKTASIKLPEEHGGCWNVQHFADEAAQFDIEKKTEWIQIKYVLVDKAYFYTERSEDKKQKAYIVKNDFVCIEKIEGGWAYCTYFGKRITKGWIKTVDLNKI